MTHQFKDNRCVEITLRNTQCKKRKRGESFCCMHYKECSICIQEMKDRVTLDCSHSFCKECIYYWLVKAGNCPMCRTNVKYSYRLDSINHNILNGSLVTVQSYRFTLDITLFPEFFEYTRGLMSFNQWLPREEWETLKVFWGIEDHTYRVFRSLPYMKFITYIFQNEYDEDYPIEVDENETKNIYKYKIELI
jgi:hypothetical protein